MGRERNISRNPVQRATQIATLCAGSLLWGSIQSLTPQSEDDKIRKGNFSVVRIKIDFVIIFIFLLIKDVLLLWRILIEEVAHSLCFALWSQIIKMSLRRPLEFIALKWTRREIQTSTKDSNDGRRTRRTSTSISSGQIDILFSQQISKIIETKYYS